MALPNLFGLISEKMNYLTQKQEVIANNVANANVAGYRAKDLESFDSVLSRKMAEQSSSKVTPTATLRTTDPHHLQAGGMGGGVFKVSNEKDVYEVKPSGNAVDVEQQMTQLAQTNTDYQTVTGLYKKMMGMLKLSMGSRQ